MKEKIGYILFSLCNEATMRWIDLAEAFLTAKDKIDDRLGDENFEELNPNEDFNILWFEIPLNII